MANLVAAATAVTLVACGSSSPSGDAATTATTATTPGVAGSTGGSSSVGPASDVSPVGGSITGSATGSADAGQAAAYCTKQGGQVQTRTADWGTNGAQSGWLPLAGTTTLCRFQAADEARSRTYVDLTTLSSPKPTLASLAYLSKVPMPTGAGGGGNPATGYCSDELGGSSTFGAVGSSGGGWVAKDDPDDVVVSLCVFPDLSFIDEWGLAYHSAGDVRGADLAALMAYQPGAALPPVFPTNAAAPTS